MHCLPACLPHQINNGATCLLYNTVGRMAGVGPSTLLLDVCCGTGTIGITLAKQVWLHAWIMCITQPIY
jgi:tRNA (uracil-5-)-methyltransferase